MCPSWYNRKGRGRMSPQSGGGTGNRRSSGGNSGNDRWGGFGWRHQKTGGGQTRPDMRGKRGREAEVTGMPDMGVAWPRCLERFPEELFKAEETHARPLWDYIFNKRKEGHKLVGIVNDILGEKPRITKRELLKRINIHKIRLYVAIEDHSGLRQIPEHLIVNALAKFDLLPSRYVRDEMFFGIMSGERIPVRSISQNTGIPQEQLKWLYNFKQSGAALYSGFSQMVRAGYEEKEIRAWIDSFFSNLSKEMEKCARVNGVPNEKIEGLLREIGVIEVSST